MCVSDCGSYVASLNLLCHCLFLFLMDLLLYCLKKNSLGFSDKDSELVKLVLHESIDRCYLLFLTSLKPVGQLHAFSVSF